MGIWKKAKVRLKALYDEYGAYAIGTYFTIFFGTWTLLFFSIGFGLEEGPGMTSFWAAYATTKVSQPLRVAATVVVTPVVAKLVRSVRGE